MLYIGSYYVCVSYGDNKIIYSNDSINWTLYTLPSADYYIMPYYYNNIYPSIFILTKNDKTYYTSTNGYNNWVSRTITAPNVTIFQYNFVYANGLFVGLNSTINYKESKIALISTDGINWTEITLPIGGFWYNITYYKNMYIGFTYGIYNSNYSSYVYDGAYIYSTNGINWNYNYLSNIRAIETLMNGIESLLLVSSVDQSQMVKIDISKNIKIPSLTEPSGLEYWMVAK